MPSSSARVTAARGRRAGRATTVTRDSPKISTASWPSSSGGMARGRRVARDDDVVERRLEHLEHPAASLSAKMPTRPTSLVNVKASLQRGPERAHAGGLWAASTSTVGDRRTISSRPGDVTSANPAAATSRSRRCSPPPRKASTAARAVASVARLVLAVQREEDVGVLPRDPAQRQLLAAEGDLASE